MPTTVQAAIFAVSSLASALLVAGWIRVATSGRIEDLPGQRRLHATPTPRGGGIAIAIVFLALPFLGLGASSETMPMLGLYGGVAAFALSGLLDDLVPMPTLAKFGLQLAAAAALVGMMLAGRGVEGWLAAALVLACGYFVNIWNFMDGSNGMVGLQTLLIAIALGMWPEQSPGVATAAWALAGACLGFLPFNLPRARVFLGDVGSHALGAAVFALLLASWLQGILGLGQALLISSALLLDSGFTLLRRVMAGRRIWRAHREHLYQYAVRRGHSHFRVCLGYAAWTLGCLMVAAFLGHPRSDPVMWGWVSLTTFLGAGVYFGLRQRWLDPAIHRGKGT